MTTINIMPDSDTESPRDWENMGVMVAFHGRYILGDKEHGYKSSDYNGWDELKAAILRDHPGSVILPLYMYDHSGITMNTVGYSCKWDSGQVGFIYATPEAIRLAYGVKRITAVTRTKAQDSLVKEVSVYDKYISGEVYRYEVLNDDGDVIDSCGGFYGSNPFTNGMSDHIDVSLHDELRAAEAR